MNTPFGRYRWKRLPFGLKVSSEIFQKALQQALSGLEGVECVADDIIVYGVGDTQADAEKNHDQRLRGLLHRCREKHIRLNSKKCVLKTTSISFLGHIVSDQGLRPDPKKIQAILELPNPTNKTEIQRLQGSVQYLARFLPRLSDSSEPPILTYYDPEKALVIQSPITTVCSRSPHGTSSDGHFGTTT